jgi:hypothetical protein
VGPTVREWVAADRWVQPEKEKYFFWILIYSTQSNLFLIKMTFSSSKNLK